MITRTLDLNNIERKIFWTLISLLGMMLGFYLYSVSSLTVAVVDRDRTNAVAHELAAKAAEIEQQYLAQLNSITLAYAQNIGFKEVSAKFASTARAVDDANTLTQLSMAR